MPRPCFSAMIGAPCTAGPQKEQWASFRVVTPCGISCLLGSRRTWPDWPTGVLEVEVATSRVLLFFFRFLSFVSCAFGVMLFFVNISLWAC